MIRLKETFLVLLILLFSISCSSNPAKYSISAEIPDDFLGFVHAGDSIDDYQLLNELGSVWLLQTFYWSRIERTQGEFNFSWYDNFINTAKENNKKVIAVMAYSTSWTGDKDRHISKDNISHFLNFLETTVNRYKGLVDAWQIWNEPNHVFWKGTDKEFFELSKLSAQRIRETDPDAYIIGGGILRTPKCFIKGMQKAGALENLDAISIHPYALNPFWSMRHYESFINLMADINFTGEVWITEIGFPTGGLYPTRVSMQNLPSYVVKTIVGSAVRGARTLSWYQFSDSYNEGGYPDKNNSEDYFGLTYSNRTKKNGAWAYELCARYLPGSQYLKELPIREKIPSGIVSFYFVNSKTGNNTLIIWNDINARRNIKLTVETNFTIHNIATGENSILQDGAVIEISSTPVFITWEGQAAPRISRARK